MSHSSNIVSTIHVNNADYDVHDAQAEHLENKVTSVRQSGTATNTAYPTEAAVRSAIDSAISTAVVFKGTKATVAEVQAVAPAKTGDMWIVTADNSEWVCKQDISAATASAWEMLGTVSQDLGALAYADTASASYTPAGTIGTTAAGTTTVNSITNVGTLPTFSASVVNEVLSFSFSQGTLPTKGANTTVATEGIASASFSGTSATITVNPD